MNRSAVPKEVRVLADARREARTAHDWPEADRLREQIEAAGWKVIDHGLDYDLEPAHSPDVVETGRTRYGSSTSVPSRLAEPPAGLATVVLMATDWPTDLARTLGGLRAHGPAGTQVVIVANHPSPTQEAALIATEALEPIGGIGPEIVWTSERLGHAGALNAGLRRAAAPVAILVDTSIEPTGDFASPLARVLDDPSVGVAGPWGLTTDDLRHFEETDQADVDAIEAYCLAFRRADYVQRGPFDERFRFYRNLDIWWSLVLRDEGAERSARRALHLAGLPLHRHEHREWSTVDPHELDLLSRRNFYRVLKRFGVRRDLIVGRAASSS